jgi:hypothetical protein
MGGNTMFRVTIYLKSGQSFDVYMEDFQLKRSIDGSFKDLNWTSAGKNLPHLKHLNVDDLSAIVYTEEINDADQ